jgi:malonyl-CoA/methylmalonyl-CoA synthetase
MRLGDRTPSSLDRDAWQRHLGSVTPVEDIDLTARGTLVAGWLKAWASRPEEIAIAPVPGGPRVTFEQLHDLSADRAGQLAAFGVGPGDRLVLSLPSSVELIALYVAALRLGATVVPANAAYVERELQAIVTSADPSLVIVEPGRRVEGPLATPDQIAARRAARPVLDRAEPGDPALLCFTSGTTGDPKGVVLSHRNLLASSESVRLSWRWQDADGLLLALPLFHLHGLGVGVNGSLLAGSRMILFDRFDPAGLAEAAAREDATMFFGVPTMYQRLAGILDGDGGATHAIRTLRLLVAGSAALPATLWELIRERTGHEVLERYGMTETVMNVSNLYDGPRVPGAIGHPLPGVEIRLLDRDGTPAITGQGEIALRGENVLRSYWRLGESPVDADGWFRTGDVAHRGDDGLVRIVGRTRELIISGGYNVFPREVEEVLLRHPAVAEAAVFGRPSAEWGEEVVAAVVPSAAVEVAELVAHCRDSLAPYKCPKTVDLRSSLPRNALGKILRSEL